jgi:microcystin-dependent protein
MYVGMAIEGAGIQAGTTIATISSSTAIIMSQVATASATVPVQFFSYGNGNGTTTFTLPDSRRRVSMGSGGSASSTIPPGVGNITGQTGGQELHALTIAEMPAHNHPGSTVSFDSDVVNPSGSNGVAYNQDSHAATALNIASQGSGTAHNTIQPSLITTKCIKYQ